MLIGKIYQIEDISVGFMKQIIPFFMNVLEHFVD